LRTPHVFVLSQDLPDGDQAWFQQEVVEGQLRQYGWEDLMIAVWASRPDRMIGLTAYRSAGDPPFSTEDRKLSALILRAAAPVIDREMFDVLDGLDQPVKPQSPLEGRELSERQRDVLILLLRGHSEKEVARDLGVSTHTVHTHVKRLYTEFDVSSRGELLALFVDRRILRDAAA
jgi:DNA-binding NarL/FixJ family response regulator